MDHLRYAGVSPEQQSAAFLDIVRNDSLAREALLRARDLDLPDWWIVSGVLYNTVWNHLTGRTSGYGVKDVDLFYFDDGDLSWDAEDIVIRRGQEIFHGLAKPAEIRNQPRVHLWFEDRFGQKRGPLGSSRESIAHFATRAHAVGVRLDSSDDIELYAPYGLEDIFAFRIAPNYILDNRATHETKAARAKAAWPELTVVPW